MEKTIEIPEGYEARIEGNKVILEQKKSENERIREVIESIIRVYGKTQGEWLAGYDMDTLVVHLRDAFAYLERQKEQKPFPAEDEKDFLEKEVKAFLCNYDKEFDDDAPTYDIAEHFYQLGKNSQKPAEWSEADKLHLNNAILVAKKEWGVNSYTARWLESLRDNYKKCNSRWKPSEEQYECIPAEEAYMRGFAQGAKEERERMLEDIIKMRDTAEKRGLNFGAVCGFQIALDELEQRLTGKH